MTQAMPPAGWYPDPNGGPGRRYFDGIDWTQNHLAPDRPVLSESERSAVLDRAVMMAVSRGGRVEYRTPTQAVIVYGRQVNNVLHALLFIFTCGLWLLIWLFLLASGGERREVLDVDPYGSVVSALR